jgi:hypothetical protein
MISLRAIPEKIGAVGLIVYGVQVCIDKPNQSRGMSKFESEQSALDWLHCHRVQVPSGHIVFMPLLDATSDSEL